MLNHTSNAKSARPLNIPNIIASFAMQFYQKTKHFFVKMKVEFDQSIIQY